MNYNYKPNPSEYPEFYQAYIEKLDDLPIVQLFEQESKELASFIDSIPEEKANYAYAPGKWTVSEALIHILDSSYIFFYRCLSISRGEQNALPGFDQDLYMETVISKKINFKILKSSLIQFLRLQKHYIQLLSAENLQNEGTANNAKIKANTIAYISVGHCRHHMNILKTKYGL